jgi:hypothetical protein
MRSICGRCHRVREVNGVRYCEGCAAELRRMEQRRRTTLPAPPDVKESSDLAPEIIKSGLVSISTETERSLEDSPESQSI